MAIEDEPNSYLCNALFCYNAEDGTLLNKYGEEVGCFSSTTGYRVVRITTNEKSHLFYVHRIIWIMQYNEHPIEIDHINGNRLDNRLNNLRACSHAENHKNVKRPTHNSSGITGVAWHKQAEKWRAFITIKQKQKHLGLFSTKEEAIQCRKIAETKYGFHSNHGR
jgi:hypothetical protein